MASSLEPFLAQAERADRIVPRFVQRELRRGFCPSCGGRRMADTAAHLVHRVLPRVPVRQWVLTLHFHTLVLDGVYVQDGPNEVRFRPLPPPDDDEMARIGARIAHRLARLLERHGFGQDDQTGDVGDWETASMRMTSQFRTGRSV